MTKNPAKWLPVLVVALGMTQISRAAAPAKAEIPRDVTFAKDIAPILQRSCQNCHRPNSIAPMSLLTYQEVRPWARAIKETMRRNAPSAAW
jgi:hypothetical protein